jgi:hypothetical protein
MVVVAGVMMAGSVLAKDHWEKVADLNAGGDAKEVAISREISAIRLDLKSGTVTVNTVVVRQGAAKTSYAVASRLADKTPSEIKLPSKANVTGLRISDAGRGVYAVYVK